MTEEVRITYKRKPGAAPNYPKESDLPADEVLTPRLATIAKHGSWRATCTRQRRLSVRMEVPRFLSQSRRIRTSSVRTLSAKSTQVTK